MNATEDPFLAQPGQAGMRPAEPSVQPQPHAQPGQEFVPQAGQEFLPASQATPEYGTMQAPAQAPTAPGYGAPAAQQPAAPAYPPQYEQGYAPGYPQQYYPPARPMKTWMNVTSLVTALVGIGLAAVIFGHLGVRAANRGEAEYKGLGIAGLILGYIGIVGTIVYLGVILVALTQFSTTG